MAWAALVALNLIVYAPVRQFEFVNWDDPTYITENAHVQQGLTRQSVTWALTTAHAPYWHPVTWLSHLLDVQLFEQDAGAHHITNLLIHIANTVLLFALLRGMTGAAGRSAFVAALFAVHPLHVESVAWIAERKDVLSTFFWLLAIRAYVGYVRHPRPRRYLAVVGLFALALMSKPMVVTLPLVLLLLDIWPLRRVAASLDQGAVWRRLIVEKLPLLALAIATSIVTVLIQQRVGALASLAALSWHARAANAVVAYVAYAARTIWPAHLAAFYPQRGFPAAIVVAAGCALVATSVAALRCRREQPYVLVGWLWYVFTLAPVIGLLQAGEQAMADRFTYVPMVGLLVIVAWGIPELLMRWRPARLLPVSAMLVAVLSAAAARAQVVHWSDSIALWRHAASVTRDNYLAYENLGQALRERGQLEEAHASYTRALALAPAGSPAYAAVIHNALGLVLARQGKTRDALASFAAAVHLNPSLAEARINLGNTLAAEGKPLDAIEQYRAALHIAPDLTEAQVGLGAALLSQGKAADAVAYYRDALRRAPGLAEAHNGLGAALANTGHDGEAMEHYLEALRLKPDLPTAHFNLAVLLVKQDKIPEARRHLETALTIDPDYGSARQALTKIGR